MHAPRRVRAALLLAGWGALLTALAEHPSAAQSQSAAPSEITTQESQPSFKLQVERNLVVVRAVVRDAKGEAVGSLHKEDFLIFDDGKPQSISQFSVEGPGATSPPAPRSPRPRDEEAEPDAAAGRSIPQRYMALYFDDMHMPFEEMARARDAADAYLGSEFQPSDRAALFTASGLGMVDFTDDRVKLHDALLQLRDRSRILKETEPCPDLPDYQAFLIIHQNEPYASEEVAQELVHCRYHDDTRYLQTARSEAFGEATRVLSLSGTETEATLRGIEGLTRRMAALPGQRSLVVVSSGFFSETLRAEVDALIDRALRSQVVVSAVDARGLYASLPGGDASRQGFVLPRRLDLTGKKGVFEIQRLSFAMDAMRQMANSTGGALFENNNDLVMGFRKVGTLPRVYYILAFSPSRLKYDGRFHNLKVRLARPTGLTLQARSGYFAPRNSPDSAEQEKDEIAQALFSQDQVSELPVEVRTQFFKPNSTDATLSVLTRLDVHPLHFRKEGGRNLTRVTFVTGVFDRDGNLVSGREKKVEFRLLDASLERLLKSGVAIKTSFEVPPGTYQVREVVRESEGGQMAGMNRTVEIPY